MGGALSFVMAVGASRRATNKLTKHNAHSSVCPRSEERGVQRPVERHNARRVGKAVCWQLLEYVFSCVAPRRARKLLRNDRLLFCVRASAENKHNYTIEEMRERYESYFALERRMLTVVESDFAPHFFGGCWSSFGTIVHVEEYLRGYMDAAGDPSVTLEQRIQIAINTIKVLVFLDNFPTSHTTQSKVIYGEWRPTKQTRETTIQCSHIVRKKGDLFAKQFAIDDEYNVKIVDMQSLFPYSSARFGDHYRCTEHAHCEAKFWYARQYPMVLRGLRKLAPDDFGCDLAHGLCRGLDSQTTLMALCHLLVEPLLLLVEPPPPPKTKRRLDDILTHCMMRERALRGDIGPGFLFL